MGYGLASRLVLALGDKHFAVRPIPSRNLVPPPQLARDAPRLDVLHPIEIRRLPIARHEYRARGAHRGDRRRGKRLRVHVPLIGEKRLDHDRRAVAVRHHVRVRLGLCEQTRNLEPPHDVLAHDEAIEAMIGQRLLELRRGRHVAQKRLVTRKLEMRLGVKHVDERQIMPTPHLEVVEVVRRRDLDRTGAFLRIGVFVGDDRNAPADQRQDGALPHQMPVALIVGMHRDRHVAEHRLRPRGRNRDERDGSFASNAAPSSG